MCDGALADLLAVRPIQPPCSTQELAPFFSGFYIGMIAASETSTTQCVFASTGDTSVKRLKITRLDSLWEARGPLWTSRSLSTREWLVSCANVFRAFAAPLLRVWNVVLWYAMHALGQTSIRSV